jgi:hypothetical protein
MNVEGWGGDNSKGRKDGIWEAVDWRLFMGMIIAGTGEGAREEGIAPG